MWLPNKTDCFTIIRAFPFICLCGIVGILPDIDHVVAHFNGVTANGDFRIWHPAIFIVVVVAMCIIGTLSTGLYIGSILRKK
jgi:hypothetical protein